MPASDSDRGGSGGRCSIRVYRVDKICYNLMAYTIDGENRLLIMLLGSGKGVRTVWKRSSTEMKMN